MCIFLISVVGCRFVKIIFQLFQCFFLDAGHIGTGNVQLFRHLTLRQRTDIVQSIPIGQNLLLPRFQILLDKVIELLRLDTQVNAVQDVFIVLHNIHQSDGISILININRVADGDVLHTLSLLPKVHEYLICYPHLMELHSPRKV